MNKILIGFLVFFLTADLVACASNTKNMNMGIGTIFGAAVGVLLTGNPIIAAGGGLVGGTIGHTINSVDKKQK